MIHEHEATELASAAIDFGQSPEVERELAESLRDCPICAERAAGYREQIRLMQRLPVVDVSEATRRRVTAAALGDNRRSGRSPLALALAAALLLALLLALTAAAGALLQNRRPVDLLTTVPTPSAPLTVVAPSQPAPKGPPAGGAIFSDTLPPDSLAEVVETNVRVRSQPRVAADSARLTPFLQPGDRLFVVDGPVVADNYDWYQIVPIGTDPARPGSSLPTGWVSRGDHDARPWIKPAAPNCPSTPVDIAQLSTMHRLERLACFGSSTLSFTAVVDEGRESDWIAETSVGAETGVAGTPVAIKPSATNAPVLSPGQAMLVAGAFDDPSCEPGGRNSPIGVLDCRATFVVTDATADVTTLHAGDTGLTVTDNLRVRSLPVVDGSSAKLELLPAGTRFGIVGGPAVGSGFVWLQIAVPSIRTPAGGPRIGWVAAHSKTGEPWVGADDLACPPPNDASLGDLARLTAEPVFHGGVVCYGRDAAAPGAEITLSAYLRRDCNTPPASPTTWLTDPRRTVVLTDGTDEVQAVLSAGAVDSLDCGGSGRRTRFDATGHFDDPAAAECRVEGVEATAAVYECRSRFVITDIRR